MTRPQASRHEPSGLALPLALIYCGLAAYASLYPFTPWQSQGIMPWAFITAPLPHYWSGFDVAINVLGYIPLGFLLTVALADASRRPAWWALSLVAVLSFVMEALQTYLAPRVSSNVDWALNVLGGSLGAWAAALAEATGLLRGWSRWRGGHFDAGSGAALGLLLLWPLALLYPTPVPLGLGHLGGWLQWLAVPVTAGLESFLLMLGLLAPVLLAFSITPKILHRVFALVWIALAALAVTTLSTVLSFGPAHAGVWLHDGVAWGLCLGLGSSAVLLVAPRRLNLVLLLGVLVLMLALVNTAPQNPYFAQTLAVWEQGRFIRFYGMTQWLGWLWPYATLALVTYRLSTHKI